MAPPGALLHMPHQLQHGGHDDDNDVDDEDDNDVDDEDDSGSGGDDD